MPKQRNSWQLLRQPASAHNFWDEYGPQMQQLQSQTGEGSVRSMITLSSQFLSQYGVTLQIPRPDEISANQRRTIEGIEISDLSTLEEENLKASIMGVSENIGRLPVELVQKAGLTRMVLIRINPELGYAAFADTNEGHTFYVNALFGGLGIGSNVALHEFNHLLSTKTCDSSPEHDQIDPMFAHASQPIPYCENRWQTPTICSDQAVSYDDAASELSRTQAAAELWLTSQGSLNLGPSGMLANISAPDRTLSKEALRQKLKKQLYAHIIAPSDYAFKNQSEYKAELGAGIEDFSRFNAMFDKDSPLLRTRALLFATRMEELVPGAVEYFNELGNRAYVSLAPHENPQAPYLL
jgi:hypothetical protein